MDWPWDVENNIRIKMINLNLSSARKKIMKPEIGKEYKIQHVNHEDPSRNFSGVGKCHELACGSEKDEQLYIFFMEDGWALFGKDDIVGEITE